MQPTNPPQADAEKNPDEDTRPTVVLKPVDWFSAIQLALSLLAVSGLWLLAAFAGLAGLLQAFGGRPLEGVPMLQFAAATGASGLLVIPSAVYALNRLAGWDWLKRLPPLPELQPRVLVWALPLVLFLGWLVSQQPWVTLVALPPLHVLAVGLPIWWLYSLASRGLRLGSAQRKWGVLAGGLVLGPSLILLLELGALLVFVLIGLAALANRPELLAELERLAQTWQAAPPDPEEALQVLEPYLINPFVIGAAFIFGAGIVPLIEEALKPIGVWLLAGKNPLPATGFVAGALSGAGYAFFESLALTSTGQDWVYLMVVRIGTAIIHILTSALTGWALALAWREKRYLRLAAAYLLAVVIHGLWNGQTLANSLAALLAEQDALQAYPLIARVGPYAPAGLAVLTVGGFAVLLLSNRNLRRAQAEPVSVAAESTA